MTTTSTYTVRLIDNGWDLVELDAQGNDPGDHTHTFLPLSAKVSEADVRAHVLEHYRFVTAANLR